MKILVLYNSEIKDSATKIFDKGITHLKKQGHNLKTDIEIRKGLKPNNEDSAAKYQARVEKMIRDTDIIVVETTEPDAKLGYDIAKAISEKKIVIAMQNDSGVKKYIPTIHGNNAKNLLRKPYTSKNVEEVISTAVDQAKGMLDSKFILIISPEIDRYLDWASQTKRLHKAQIVRNAMETTMKKDREYKTYLLG